jgi:hypothetical protein
MSKMDAVDIRSTAGSTYSPAWCSIEFERWRENFHSPMLRSDHAQPLHPWRNEFDDLPFLRLTIVAESSRFGPGDLDGEIGQRRSAAVPHRVRLVGRRHHNVSRLCSLDRPSIDNQLQLARMDHPYLVV